MKSIAFIMIVCMAIAVYSHASKSDQVILPREDIGAIVVNSSTGNGRIKTTNGWKDVMVGDAYCLDRCKTIIVVTDTAINTYQISQSLKTRKL